MVAVDPWTAFHDRTKIAAITFYSIVTDLFCMTSLTENGDRGQCLGYCNRKDGSRDRSLLRVQDDRSQNHPVSLANISVPQDSALIEFWTIPPIKRTSF
jgi:hypothetical protein